MLKTLISKQLYEVFKGYFYDAKKNKARSKIATIFYFILFVVLIYGCVGLMFFGLSSAVYKPLDEVGLIWLYFIIMGIVSILLGVFASVFITYSNLYMSKDNELLLSMPIPVKTIVLSRLFNVYFLGTLYSLAGIIPTIAFYFYYSGFSINGLIGCVAYFLVITILVFILSCLLGYVVAKISSKIKHKSFTTLAISILFIAAYYFFYFKASAILQKLIENIVYYGEIIKDSSYVLYLFGTIPTGNFLAISIYLGILILLSFVLTEAIIKSFTKIVTSTGVQSKTKYKEKKVAQSSPLKAMIRKEMTRFTASANYMLNCGFGILFIVVGTIALFVKGSFFKESLMKAFENNNDFIVVILCAVLTGLVLMNDIVVPSISLEGKNLWIYKSLPVKSFDILKAKMSIQLMVVGVPLLFASLGVLYTFGSLGVSVCLSILVAFVALILGTEFHMLLAIKMPLLEWTNEIYPIKQSFAVLFALLIGMALPAGIFLVYMYFVPSFGVNCYLLIIMSAMIILTIVLNIWLRKRGTKLFEAL